MENRDEKFSYTYSAKQQEEINNIRKKYLNPEADKMEQLRRLDARVTSKATSAALAVGIVGTLIFGFGMSLIMTELSMLLGLFDVRIVIGVIVGVVGFALVGCAYPIYSHILKKEREKVAPEILRLTDELMK